MARLFEYQAKQLLALQGIGVPRGAVAATPAEARQVASSLGVPVVVKAQAWVTGRAALGAVRFAADPNQAEEAARAILGISLKGFIVDQVLVEERLDVEQEFYAAIALDDRVRGLVALFSRAGGSGVEQAATAQGALFSQPIRVRAGLPEYHARNLALQAGVRGALQGKLAGVIQKLYTVASTYEARSVEVNPLVISRGGDVHAVDCRISIDDSAVFRHPELGIEVAREFDRPPTPLDRIAYGVEKNDYRGTFYFAQLETPVPGGDYVGFHGGGGGGSMMAMDALIRGGFKLANFCDTSGNPPASKVYRAARIILSQPNLVGYFHSGSGVASQEQVQTARGLVKAFRETNLSIPAVIRIGGNMEEEAIRILLDYTEALPGRVEAYGRDTDVDYCVARLRSLVQQAPTGAVGVERG